MGFSRLPPALLVLMQAALLSRTASALAVNAMNLNSLFPRDNTCAAGEDWQSCQQDLPDNFCCKKTDTCIRLNNTGAAAAALCCPTGVSCDNINVIVCDAKFQDPTQFPGLPLHSSDTTIPLPTCGDACCPLGYECVNNGDSCRIKDLTKQSQTEAASTFVPSTSTVPPSSETSTAEASTTTTSSSATSSGTSSPVTVQPKEKDNTSTAGLVMAGLFPGLLLGSMITFGVLFWLKKRRQQQRGYKSDAGSSMFGPPTPHDSRPPKISEPIYQPGMSDRVVFGHARTASGNPVPEMTTARGDFYKPSTPSSDNRSTADSATLVSPPATGSVSRKAVRTLDPPFETPTKPGRNRDGTKSFFSRSSSRTSRRRDTQQSTETTTMTMSPPRVPSSYQGTPAVRQTTYSDVYRAAGVSPSQVRSTRPSEDVTR